jgi:septum formation protein
MNRIILASQSPRRRDLLEKMGVQFTAIPSKFDEHLDESRDAEDVAQELALGKALAVAQDYPDDYVIGSDLVVAINGRQMEKPVDIHDAREMLIALCGGESTVSTGVVVVNLAKGIQKVGVASTKVHFYPDSEAMTKLRETYLATGDWKDKAAGYGIQSGAAPLIEYIDGDYDTIVGLPTRLLAQFLTELGIPAKPVFEAPPVRQVTHH